MSVSGYFIPGTTPENEIKGLDRRIRIVQEAIQEAVPGSFREFDNRAALRNYKELREGWQAELDEVRRGQIEHTARMYRIHARIAREHYARHVALLREGVIAPDEPSTNGTH